MSTKAPTNNSPPTTPPTMAPIGGFFLRYDIMSVKGELVSGGAMRGRLSHGAPPEPLPPMIVKTSGGTV